MPRRKAAAPTGLELCTTIEEFLDDYAAASPKTLANYRDHVGRALRNYLVGRGIVSLEEVTPQILREYLIAEANSTYEIKGHVRKHSQGTVVHRYETASRFFGWCVEQDYLAENPMAKVRSPERHDPGKVGFTNHEVKSLLTEAAKGWHWIGLRDRAIMTILLGTGIRAAELLGLTFDDLEWDLRDLKGPGAPRGNHGPHRRIRVVAKGQKVRRIPLGDTAAKALKAYLRARPDFPTNYVWVSWRHGPLTYGALNMMFHNVGSYAGVGDVTPHRFRHTFAYEHYMRHKDIKALQHALGHARITTTDRYLRTLGITYGSDLETPDSWLA